MLVYIYISGTLPQEYPNVSLWWQFPQVWGVAKDLFEGESSSELQPNATVPEASSWKKDWIIKIWAICKDLSCRLVTPKRSKKGGLVWESLPKWPKHVG